MDRKFKFEPTMLQVEPRLDVDGKQAGQYYPGHTDDYLLRPVYM